ncbi:muconolactone Delta-isomerase family protein [Actinoplanes solisilvae]|uniref:muconolactone Delta-isomerase family protein n=1 Tax=Actinoplanes solisilvae TaxID=2486853 RepID=UPI000FDA30BC|nr:muconolactone Delta-isomerase family protein [Actinoplanes solisilvae]
MEYLVTMVTRVPDGTSEQEVDDVRAREAANTARLVTRGKMLRLWRPPLGPGEWRSIGVFTAGDADELETTLAGMPLRVWRTDSATPLGEHPNDPGPGTVKVRPDWTEYLVTLDVGEPDDDEVFEREAERARELAAQGHLERLWRLGERRFAGVWQAADPAELDEILRALPLAKWLTIDTVPLTRHPSDPEETR